MPPVRRDQLVVGQEYYIRDDTFLGPWGGAFGLLPFTYDGGISFHVTIAAAAEFDALSDNWLFFPIADGPPVPPPGGVPVPPPVVAPAPPPGAAALPDGGPLFISDGAQNVATMENIAVGDQLVNWNMHADPEGRRESNFGHYYTANTYNQLPNPKISPTTRARINTKNPKRYTASRRMVNTAFPQGSANAGLFERSRSRRKRKAKSRKNKRS
jgi:hypothetical protein